MKKKGILLKTDGTKVPVFAKDQRKGFSLQELYELIGNGCDTIQIIHLRRKGEMYLDDEGKLHTVVPPINEKATVLLQEAGGFPGDFVVGNVVVFD